MLWFRNKKKKENKTMSFHTVFAPLAKHYTVSKQTAMLRDQTKYWVVWCCSLSNPLLIGGKFCLPGFIFIFPGIGFLCLFFGTHFKKHWNFIWAFYRFK